MDIHTSLHLFHIILVGGLFLYIGINEKNTPNMLLNALLPLGIIILLYHLYRSYVKLTTGKSIWVNLIHILLVAPLLIYIGYNNKTTARLYFELLLMLGFAAIGYHGYYLIKG